MHRAAAADLRLIGAHYFGLDYLMKSCRLYVIK